MEKENVENRKRKEIPQSQTAKLPKSIDLNANFTEAEVNAPAKINSSHPL